MRFLFPIREAEFQEFKNFFAGEALRKKCSVMLLASSDSPGPVRELFEGENMVIKSMDVVTRWALAPVSYVTLYNFLNLPVLVFSSMVWGS